MINSKNRAHKKKVLSNSPKINKTQALGFLALVVLTAIFAANTLEANVHKKAVIDFFFQERPTPTP